MGSYNNMLHQHLNRNCPHCGGYLEMVQYLDSLSPRFEAKSKIFCTKCNRTIAEEELNQVEETTASSTATSGTVNCPICGESLYMAETPNGKRCFKCGYT